MGISRPFVEGFLPCFNNLFFFRWTIGENLGVAPEDMDTAKYTVEKEEINDITEKSLAGVVLVRSLQTL